MSPPFSFFRLKEPAMKTEVVSARKKHHAAEPAPEPEKQEAQEPEVAPEVAPEVRPEVAPERQKASVHIALNTEMLENVRELADYAADVGLIHNDPRGNVTDFINWCIEVGRETLRQYALHRRKFI